MPRRWRWSLDGLLLHRKMRWMSQTTTMTMIHEEDPEVAHHIIILQGESTKTMPRTTLTMTREVGMAETELLLPERRVQEALELITPDVTAIRIILILVTKDHRRLIRRTR